MSLLTLKSAPKRRHGDDGNYLNDYNGGFVLGENSINESSSINPDQIFNQNSNETNGNEFYGSSTSIPDLLAINTNASEIKYYYTSSETYRPYHSEEINGNAMLLNLISGTSYSCPENPIIIINPCCNGNLNTDIAEDMLIVNNGLSFSTSDASLDYFTLKKNLYSGGVSSTFAPGYNSLAAEVTADVISDTVADDFSSFFDTIASSNIGKFVLIQNYVQQMADTSISTDSIKTLVNSALETDSLINDVYIYESNLKSVDSIYLKTIPYGVDGFDSMQTATLYSIALQCPYTGGEAVFDARALLHLINDTTNYDDSFLCITYDFDVAKKAITVLKDSSYTFNLFPNPTNSTINLSYNLGKLNNVELDLYDIMGEKLLVANLDSKNNFITIDVSKLSPGLYYARVATSAKNIFGSKFSVIR